ncbi:MAG TPA: acetylpolyamine amidohydrolase, partial [Halomonas sp.]|nr:acetylpolyamine amidohydrolase [Halomonas sp.]
MLTFFSEGSRRRQARSELHDGALVTPFECPERIDLVLAALRQA